MFGCMCFGKYLDTLIVLFSVNSLTVKRLFCECSVAAEANVWLCLEDVFCK